MGGITINSNLFWGISFRYNAIPKLESQADPYYDSIQKACNIDEAE